MDVIISYASLDECKQYYSHDQTRLQFIESVQKFLHSRNESLTPHSTTAAFVPVINSKCLDIYDLYNHVSAFGGFEVVNREQKWGLISSKLGFPSNETASLVMQSYTSLLLALEQTLRPQRPPISHTIPVQQAAPISYPRPQPMTTAVPTPKLSHPVTNTGNIGGGPFPHSNHSNSMNNSNMNMNSMNGMNMNSMNNNMNNNMNSMNNNNLHPITIPPAANLSSNMSINMANINNINSNADKFKRPRPPIPMMQPDNTYNAEVFSDRLNAAIKELNAKDPAMIVKSLNYLMQKSFELTDSHAIQVENCPHLLISLAALLDIVNPIGDCLFPVDSTLNSNLLTEADNWSLNLPIKGNLEFKILSISIEESPFLFPILSILRNLTMETSNELLVGSSLGILRHVVAVSFTSLVASNYLTDTVNLALDILSNVASKIDITGRRKQYNLVWMDTDHSDTANKRFLLRSLITDSPSDSSTLRYQQVMLSLAALLTKFLKQNDNRIVIMRALDILGKLAQNSDNAVVFSRSPDEFFQALVELLCVSFTAIDPLGVNLDGTVATGSNRRPPASVGVNYFVDCSDIDIRDNTLEALSMLSQLSNTIQVRLAAIPNFIKILLKICDTSRTKYRTEGMQRAYHLLSQMIQRLENMKKFQAIHLDMISMAYYDDIIAELLVTCPPSLYISNTVIVSNPLVNSSSISPTLMSTIS